MVYSPKRGGSLIVTPTRHNRERQRGPHKGKWRKARRPGLRTPTQCRHTISLETKKKGHENRISEKNASEPCWNNAREFSKRIFCARSDRKPVLKIERCPVVPEVDLLSGAEEAGESKTKEARGGNPSVQVLPTYKRDEREPSGVKRHRVQN